MDMKNGRTSTFPNTIRVAGDFHGSVCALWIFERHDLGLAEPRYGWSIKRPGDAPTALYGCFETMEEARENGRLVVARDLKKASMFRRRMPKRSA